MLCFCPGDAMTVYLDGVWLVNGLVDYLLLVASGKLTATPIRRSRILLAGCLGGLYGIVCLLPGWSFLGSIFWRGIMAFLLCLLAFGFGKHILRQMVVLLLLTAAFFGVVLLLTELFSTPAALIGGSVYYPVNTPTLVLTAGCAYGLISWGMGRLSHQGGDIIPVEVSVGEQTIGFNALRDTGNTLRDPISGVPVMVADQSLLKKLLPGKPVFSETPQQLLEELYREAPRLRPRLIPYKTVGVAHGMLVALQPDEIKISGRRENILMAFSPVSVSDGGGYQALLGGT